MTPEVTKTVLNKIILPTVTYIKGHFYMVFMSLEFRQLCNSPICGPPQYGPPFWTLNTAKMTIALCPKVAIKSNFLK
jgi:hypothetical protein